MIEFWEGLVGAEVASIEPYLCPGGPVRGVFPFPVGMFCVGLVCGVNLLPEELVKGLEVPGNLVGGVRLYVPE